MDRRFITLSRLAVRLGLPRQYLREQARRGLIPYLLVGGRMRFEESAVCEALRRQSSGRSDVGAVAEAERAR